MHTHFSQGNKFQTKLSTTQSCYPASKKSCFVTLTYAPFNDCLSSVAKHLFRDFLLKPEADLETFS